MIKDVAQFNLKQFWICPDSLVTYNEVMDNKVLMISHCIRITETSLWHILTGLVDKRSGIGRLFYLGFRKRITNVKFLIYGVLLATNTTQWDNMKMLTIIWIYQHSIILYHKSRIVLIVSHWIKYTTFICSTVVTMSENKIIHTISYFEGELCALYCDCFG